MSELNATQIGKIYRINEEIGRGSFGIVYAGINTQTNKKVAIKCEKMSAEHPQLYTEYLTYKAVQGEQGIPKVFFYTQENFYNILVVERLGLSLDTLFKDCGQQFSLKTVLMIANQVLTIIEYFHSKGFIHRDLKPSNFLTGLGSQCNIFYMIDYGLAMKYRDPHTNEHIKLCEKEKLIGTARFAAINAGLGCTQSRRDDLEALGYMFIYFLRGSLPWDGENARNKSEKFLKITEQKMSINIELLCVGLPKEIVDYMMYCKNLKFTETPDYKFLRQLLGSLFKRKNLSFDYNFDWSEKRLKELREM